AAGAEVELTGARYADRARAEVEDGIWRDVVDFRDVARIDIACADIGRGRRRRSGVRRGGRTHAGERRDCRDGDRPRKMRSRPARRSHFTAPGRPARLPPALPEAWTPRTSWPVPVARMPAFPFPS